MHRRPILAPGEMPNRQVPLSLAALREPQCGQCKLHKGCMTPKMPVKGKGGRGILVVGEAPNQTDDEMGRPFVGETGQHLRSTLGRLGVDLFRDCWVTNALSCRPPKNKIPKEEMIGWCRPKVLRLIHELQPSSVVLLGGRACESVIGWMWQEDAGGIMRWAGYKIPSRRLNAWVCPAYHPSFVKREGKARREDNPAQVIWEGHLEAAFAKDSRPYKESPVDPESLVRRPKDPEEAARLLRQYGDVPLAFDYETDRAKPDHADAEILTAAFSDGETAVAFPWMGAAKRAAQEILFGNQPKVAHNMKFETKWTSRQLGGWVNNLVLDTMVAVHTMNNQPMTKSLKFQAFVQLGVDRYDDHLKAYMGSDSGNSRNRLREVSLDKLLLYNGLDALYTMQLGRIVGPQVGVEL